MGQFAKDIRFNKRLGPSKRGFNRETWEELKSDNSLDMEDERVLSSGLMFDDIMTFLRGKMQLFSINMEFSAKVRLIVALSVHNSLNIVEDMRSQMEERGKLPTMCLDTEMSKMLQTPMGQDFFPDELITSLGDSLTLIFSQLISCENKDGGRSEYQADASDIQKLVDEMRVANIYQVAVEKWHHCVGNGYGVVKHSEGIVVVPFDRNSEIARSVSIYRRQSNELQDSLRFHEVWTYSLSKVQKQQLSEIKLVSKVYGQERINRIEVGCNHKTLKSTMSTVQSHYLLKQGYYKMFLDEPLPSFKGVTINQMILGWRLLQSLANSIFDTYGSVKQGDIRGLLCLAPRISKGVLRGTVSRALSCDTEQSNKILDALTFDGSSGKNVWSQPLLLIGNDYCLVVPSIISAYLQRIVENWMRQGGLALDRKGSEFEQFCREELTLEASRSPIQNFIEVVDHAVKVKGITESCGDIDIVVVVGSTVLLIEAKCILWPDDALQYANYHDTIKKAVKQVLKKRKKIQRYGNGFMEELKTRGYSLPCDYKLVCCVLTNSVVFSGFPIEDVPIIDLAILESFFRNKHTKMEVRQSGKTIYKHEIQFYKGGDDAGKVLESYLLDPPQLSDTKQFVQEREVDFPVVSEKYGKIVFKSYNVEVDEGEMLERYGSLHD